MEHLAAFMLLVGCSSDASVCKEIPVSVPAYESLADCQNGIPLQIRLSQSNAPRILGACKAISDEALDESASIEWAVSHDGRLSIDFNAEPQIVASK